MGISVKDTYILWSRAGFRCAFPNCRLELITGGDPNTLGEMAHIVARSEDGPRGDDPLPLVERDQYSNLILLCPTHHTLIDKCPGDWTVSSLHDMKRKHEAWVTEQLDAGRISIASPDNSKFLAERKSFWLDSFKGGVWMTACLTPIDVSTEVIELPSRQCASVLNSLTLPDDSLLSPITQANAYNTRPTENGLINEEHRDLQKGVAWQVEVFRNGHSEFLMCLEAANQSTSGNLGTPDAPSLVYYMDIYNGFSSMLDALVKIWTECLPFNDLVLSISIANTKEVQLFSQKGDRGFDSIIGPKFRQQWLEASRVFSKGDKSADLLEFTLKRIVNGYGLDLPLILNERGKPVLPVRFRTR